ncbi:MAG: hypothetical protein COC24_003140 [Alphaproteobacteria bacterium]|nr:hypothetical protein [Alphaproteobacteria bacterium]
MREGIFVNANSREQFKKLDYVPELTHIKAEFLITGSMLYLQKLKETADQSDPINIELMEINNKTISYLKNIIQNENLRVFYITNLDNDQLFDQILYFFKDLTIWEKNEKTSPKNDVKAAENAIKYLLKAHEELMNSSDLRRLLQTSWKDGLVHMIFNTYDRDVTEDGAEILQLARNIIFKKENSETNLRNLELITFHFDVENTDEFAAENYLFQLAHCIVNVTSAVKSKTVDMVQVNRDKAHIVYAVRNLKKIMINCNVKKNEHVKHIVDIINAVIFDDLDGDEFMDDSRVRGILRHNK